MNTLPAMKQDRPPHPMPITTVSQDGSIASFLAKASEDPLSSAFDRKFTIHAGMGGPAAEPSETEAAFEAVLNQRPGNGLAIYIHVPFCHNQCLYCGFSGRRPEGELCAAYTDALTAEIKWWKDRPASAGAVRAVYLGGGTPTALEPSQLDRILSALAGNFDLANDCEITLEGRLHDFSRERAAGFIAAGFNRFSIGIQSFDTAVRRGLGRISDREKVIDTLSQLIGRQKAAVIIDLIYGLPGQSPDDFVNDLKAAEKLGVDGLDTYQLNVFPGSKLALAVEEKRIAPPAALSDQGEYYRMASEYLLGRRWKQLSLSHFALTSRERNIYNPWAKKRGDCLALGAGAGGFLSGWSFYRRPDLEQYLKNAAAGRFAPEMVSPPAPNRLLSSFIVEQMEQGYLNHRQLMERFGVPPEPLGRLMRNWSENELVTIDDEWLTMTLNGRFWGVNLTQAVIETAGHSMKEN